MQRLRLDASLRDPESIDWAKVEQLVPIVRARDPRVDANRSTKDTPWEVPLAICVNSSGANYLATGWELWHAHHAAGKKTMAAKFKPGIFREAMDISFAALGRGVTRDDEVEIVRRALLGRGTARLAPDVQLAKFCNVSVERVAEVRMQLEFERTTWPADKLTEQVQLDQLARGITNEWDAMVASGQVVETPPCR